MAAPQTVLEGPVIGLLGVAASRVVPAGAANPAPRRAPAPPPGQPPAFVPARRRAGDPPATIAEAEKLVQVTYTANERAQAAANWRVSLAPVYERRTGPKNSRSSDAGPRRSGTRCCRG